MQWIVRSGNHFIRIEGKWCLIDGPWFYALESWHTGSSRLIFPIWEPLQARWLEEELPEPACFHTLTWQREKWVMRRHPKVIGRMNYWASLGYPEYLHMNVHQGWIIYPDARLPNWIETQSLNQTLTSILWRATQAA